MNANSVLPNNVLPLIPAIWTNSSDLTLLHCGHCNNFCYLDHAENPEEDDDDHDDELLKCTT